MSEVWHNLKKSLHCKPHSSEVHDPKAKKHRCAKKDNQCKGNCSNILKSQAKRSMLNPVTHEIVLDITSGETKFCPCDPCSRSNKGVKNPRRSIKQTIVSMKTHCCFDCDEWNIFSKPKVKVLQDDPPPALTRRHQCDEKLKSPQNDICDEHSGIQLLRQESSCEIVKKICNVGGESKMAQIECVLKVLNTKETLACFEECRKMIMMNAEKLQDKNPRCLVDGNELLRFHGTNIACSVGVNGSSALCTLEQCGVCQILRRGFSANRELHGSVGVFTTSTCGNAIESICSFDMRKCVIVCRVIAGRINYNHMQMSDLGYDSLVGQSDMEELTVLKPGAVLPCFVVIYKF